MLKDVETVGATGEQGFRAPQVCKIVGITYRQLDYWARTDLIVPSLQTAQGSGSQRVYSFQDIVQQSADTAFFLPLGFVPFRSSTLCPGFLLSSRV